MHGGLHVLPGERPNPTRAPAENASAKQRAEEAWNGVLEAPRHHPNPSEDQTAETDDRTRVDRECFERPHEGLRSGEVHRSLSVGNTCK